MSTNPSHARHNAIRDVLNRTPRKFDPVTDDRGRKLSVAEYYGINTFDLFKMREQLTKEVYSKLLLTIEAGKSLDPSIAEPISKAIKDWALSKGVTHFCHWFQPQTGLTAEKHDAFLSLDSEGHPIEKLSKSQLIQSEPDASSFPSGGMRTTFEARGYTAWDPSSPVFIMEHTNGKTLCIPSVFISYHGDSLDEKTALLRSIEVLSHTMTELLHWLGETEIKRIVPTLGIEQEYFLIDRSFYSLRPDLIMTGRTLIGGQPPKGQQLEDHYFGSIPSRALAFMSEIEMELYKLGIPVKTRHNEVAPSQFETAPIFEEANIATDHNQLVMEVLRKVANRHHFSVLLHEKPFAGINGSGKHNNWSMMALKDGEFHGGENLLEPGATPHQNLRFLLILAAILKGVQKHAGLLRAGIASAGNDHRLGANEAPPAIISVFLGDSLTRILNDLESGTLQESGVEAAVIKLGLNKLPQVMRDNTDRNRTSPFAFTGNKFEFRAVGSSASTAFPITLLNSAVADGLADVLGRLKKNTEKTATSAQKEKVILEIIKTLIHETRPIRFEGNNYSDEWVQEANHRGLPNLRKTPEALAQLIHPTSKEMMVRLGIFSEAELHSRLHVRLERYIKNLYIEIDTLRSIVETQVLPSALAYHSQLCSGLQSAKASGIQPPQADLAHKLSSLILSLQSKKGSLDLALQKVESSPNDESKASLLSQEVSFIMADLRSACDELEAIVSDELWPLPKYREMLFIS